MIITLSKLGIEANFLNLIKGIHTHEKFTNNSILNNEKLNALYLRLETSQECLLSFLAGTIEQEREILVS